MKRILKTAEYLLSIHLLGLVMFTVFRLIEYISLNSMILSDESAGAPSHLTAFLKGVWFDNVIACYIMVLPLAVLMISACIGFYSKKLFKAANIWFCILYGIAFMASAANIPYFQYFFKDINSSIFAWFGYTATTAGMIFEESSFLIYILLYIIITALFVYISIRLRRYFESQILNAPKDLKAIKPIVLKSILTIVLALLCVFGIRGRTGYNPIKISEAYYCNDPFLNQLGISPMFNLLTSAMDDMRAENKEISLLPYEEAVPYTRKWYGLDGKMDSLQVLHRHITAKGEVQKKNVVIILMESMSLNFMKASGNNKGLTPVLDSLFDSSLSFSNFYSAGIHTNQGMTATLYSFPALMKRNLMKGTVTPKRDGIATVLKQYGYHNTFFMTHEAQYDNMNAFFRTNGYDEIYSQETYPKDSVVNSFGVPDHFIFNYALPVIDKNASTGKPFMATILTISNHPPYMIPSWFKAKSDDPEMMIVEYADYCIGDFLKKAKTKEWYDNTIFVIQADHGKLVGQADAELPQSYNHIPLIIFGGGVEPQLYTGLGMQVDVMPTLLGLMNMSYDYDGFGVNLLEKKRDKVFYSADNHVVGRDSTRYYIYAPAMQKSFCYEKKENGKLVETTFDDNFKELERYAFSMTQTAEWLEQKRKGR